MMKMPILYLIQSFLKTSRLYSSGNTEVSLPHLNRLINNRNKLIQYANIEIKNIVINFILSNRSNLYMNKVTIMYYLHINWKTLAH